MARDMAHPMAYPMAHPMAHPKFCSFYENNQKKSQTIVMAYKLNKRTQIQSNRYIERQEKNCQLRFQEILLLLNRIVLYRKDPPLEWWRHQNGMWFGTGSLLTGGCGIARGGLVLCFFLSEQVRTQSRSRGKFFSFFFFFWAKINFFSRRNSEKGFFRLIL